MSAFPPAPEAPKRLASLVRCPERIYLQCDPEQLATLTRYFLFGLQAQAHALPPGEQHVVDGWLAILRPLP